MQTFLPPQDPIHGVFAKHFCERLADLSGGRIEVKLFSAGELVPPDGMQDAVVQGLLDIELNAPQVWIGKIGLVGAAEVGFPLGLVYPTENYVYYNAIKDILREAYDQAGVYYLGAIGGGPSTCMLKNPINSLSDIKGLKIMEGGAEATFWKKLGASTITIERVGEVYSGLATGLFEGAGFGGPSLMIFGLQLQEVAKYMVWPPTTPFSRLHIVMNKNKWTSLPENLKKIFADSMELVWLESASAQYEGSIRLVDMAQKKFGVKTVSLPETESWQIAKEIREEMAAKDERVAKMLEIEREMMNLFGYPK